MLPFRALTERRLLLLATLPGVWLWLTMPVFAQESYYWTYAQHPDLSYFDHPPMVAWLIWLGSHVLGNGALGIRLGTVLCGVGTLLVGLRLLTAFGAGTEVRRTWLVLSSCVPIVMMTRFLANPDPPLVFSWLLCLYALWQARSGKVAWWLLAGVAAGCALLSKYTGAFLAVGGVLVLLFDPAMRRQLLRPGPWLGVVVAAITFLPVVLWNVGNHFESFRFQTSGRWDKAALQTRWLVQFVGLQFLVLNPVFAVLLPAAVIWAWRRLRHRAAPLPGGDLRTLWLLAFGLPMPLFFFANSFVVQVKVNWLAPAYVPLILLLSLWWHESDFSQRLATRARLCLRIAGIGTLALLLLAPAIYLVPQQRGSSWTGWAEIAERAAHWQQELQRQESADGAFYFAADYKDAAQLTRALACRRAAQGDKDPTAPVLAQNVIGEVALQFDHWESPAAHVGRDAVFVLPRPDMREDLLERVRKHFASIENVERVTVRRLTVPVLDADLYLCRGYRGPQPER